MPLIVDASLDEVTSLLGDGHEEPLVLGRWPTDWSFLYYAMLRDKIERLGVITLLVVANRYVLVFAWSPQ